MTFLTPGDPAPWFTANTTSNPTFRFYTVGGYRIILSFLGKSSDPTSRQVLQEFLSRQAQLEQERIVFFGILTDPQDQVWEDQVESLTYCKLVWDFDYAVSAMYGVCSAKATAATYRPTTFVINQNLHVEEALTIQADVADQAIADPAAEHVDRIMQRTQQIAQFPPPQMAARQAPVLLIPNVLDRTLCQHLIDLYRADGGRDSGFMRQVEGKTVEILDPGFKKRRDLLVDQPQMLTQLNQLVLQRIKPEVEKAFQFSLTRFERYLVACYEAHNQGFFNRHRDNTTKGTIHRRFAMTLNLNTGDYEGGCLWFPEYGSQLYRPDVGEAIIFSCSLLHEATPVTAGTRFALLSFFYNDEDAKLRQQNLQYVEMSDRHPPKSAFASEPTAASSTALHSVAANKGFQSKNAKKQKKK